jgi:site-specific DNA recombinase
VAQPVTGRRGNAHRPKRTGSHATSRDSLARNSHPQTQRSYLFRSRVRCRDCRRRMCGEAPRPEDVYYACPHSPRNPCDVQKYPGHPHRVSVREDRLAAVVAQFCDTHLFGPRRAAYLARMFPATAATAAKRRATKTAALRKRLAQIDAAETAHARETEALAHLDNPQAPAVTALRSRTLARFTELEDERAQLNQQLTTLARQDEDPQQDPTLLDILPHLDPATLARAPRHLLAQLYQALDLQLLYNEEDNQVTIRATLTGTTPTAITELLATHPGSPHDTPTSHNPDEPTPGDPTRKVFINRPMAPGN